MKKISVIFGRTENNYSAYIEGLDGFICTADSLEELKTEVNEGIQFHLEGLHKEGHQIPEIFRNPFELEYKWNVKCLLWYYNRVITRSALSQVTGINERQLGHYETGHSVPRPAQIKKIEAAFHQLGKEFQSVHL